MWVEHVYFTSAVSVFFSRICTIVTPPCKDLDLHSERLLYYVPMIRGKASEQMSRSSDIEVTRRRPCKPCPGEAVLFQ